VNTRLLRYSRFQAPEFLQHRLALPIILMAFTAGLPTYLMTKNVPPGWMQSPQGINLAKQMFSQSITLFLPLGAFVAAVGVISADRQQGYFRFLFSKPVNVLAYYAQTYIVHAVLFVLMFGVIVWGFGGYTVHFSVHRSMEAAVLTFVLIGGIGLLLGALTRYDGAALIAIYVLALMLQQLMAAQNGLKNGGLPDWLATISKGLPPVGKLDHLRDHLYAGTAIDMPELWHVLGYGGGAALIGFILLRRLPLAR
jgi:ABC-type transport system involved in multi-copper enzyme maturation permease subunit